MAVLTNKPRNGLLALLALAFALGLGLGACFSPNQPVCAFSCADAGLCPTGYTCGADKFCHKDGATGICPLDDAGIVDAAPQDAAPGN
jgi:hypothetical protein